MPDRLIKHALDKNATGFISEFKEKLQTAFNEVKSTVPDYVGKKIMEETGLKATQ